MNLFPHLHRFAVPTRATHSGARNPVGVPPVKESRRPAILSSGGGIGTILLAILAVFSLALAPLSASQESDLFQKANNALAHRDAKTALDLYLKIADSSGTSPALADNIAAAADLAGEPGLAEWARRTALLRRTEWWLVLAGFSAAAWAAAIALGVWKQWSWKQHTAAALAGIAGIVGGLYCAHRWMPPAGEAVVVHATPKSDGSIPAADILLSPFEGAEVVTTLQPGTRVLLAPPKTTTTSSPSPSAPTEKQNFLRIRDPRSGLAGWIRTTELRQTGK